MLDFEELDAEKDPKKLLGLLNPWVLEEAERYREKHTEWEKNALFYLGKHWIERKEGADGYVFLDDDEEHFYPVTNYTKLLCDYKLNQLAGKKIVGVVKPGSLDPTDIFNTNLAQLGLRARYQIDQEATNDRLVYLHSLIFGLGWRADFKECLPDKYLKGDPLMEDVEQPTYSCASCGYSDPTGEQVIDARCPHCGSEMTFEAKMTQQQRVGEDGQPLFDQHPLYKLTSLVVDPFRILTSRALVSGMRTHIIDQSMQPTRWIKNTFKKQGNGYTGNVDGVNKTERLPRSLKISHELKSALALKHSAIFNTVTSSEKDFANDQEESLFYKAYFPPSKNWSRGRLLIFTPDVLLYDGLPDTPMKNKRHKWWHPYTDYVWSIHPMNSEGVSLVGDLIPKNKQINAIDAMILEHLDKTATPHEVRFDNVKENNDDNTNGITTIQGVPGLPNGGAPFYLQSPSISSDVFKYRDSLVAEMEKIAKVPAVVQGLHTTGVDTFRGMKMLRETAESSESDVYNRSYEYCENYNKLKLCLMQEIMIQPDSDLSAMMHTLNDNLGYDPEEVDSFMASDLSDQWNLTVEETDFLSTTKTAEEETVQDMVAKAIISPEDLLDPIMKYNVLQRMSLGDKVDIMGFDDIKKAKWIIKLLEAKKFDKLQTVLQPYDNKALQLRVLQSWMKQPKFYSLDPQIQKAAEFMRQAIEEEVIAKPPPPPPASPSAITA